jgi:hypothetical protein
VAPPTDSTGGLALRISRRHLLIGWLGLFIFLGLGIGLEAFHGLKTGYYLDARNASRRLMFTLAHSHGTLFAVINIVFALCVGRLRKAHGTRLKAASFGLVGGLVALPMGFLLGGLKLYGGDPGPGVLLVPVGAILMLVGVGAFLAEIFANRRSTGQDDGSVSRSTSEHRAELGVGQSPKKQQKR